MKTRLFLCSIAVCITVFLTSFIQVKHQPVPQKRFTCSGPTNLRSYPALGTSGVKWTMPYLANYEFVCYYSGDDPGSYQYEVASDSQTSSTGVASFTTDVPGYYDWQVRIGCPNDGFSEWSYASFYVPAE